LKGNRRNEGVRKVIKGMKRSKWLSKERRGLKGYRRNEEVRKVIKGMKRLERVINRMKLFERLSEE
jgi:hypothetical protein